MSSEWTVWVMYLDGRSVVETAAGELEAFARRGELEGEGVALGAAYLPPGSADLVPLLDRRLGSALGAWQAEYQRQSDKLMADYFGADVDKYGDSGVR